MHEPGNILSLRFTNPAVAHASRTPAQLTFEPWLTACFNVSLSWGNF